MHSLYGVANADMYKVFISERHTLIVLFVTVGICFVQFQEPVLNNVLVKDRIQCSMRKLTNSQQL